MKTFIFKMADGKEFYATGKTIEEACGKLEKKYNWTDFITKALIEVQFDGKHYYWDAEMFWHYVKGKKKEVFYECKRNARRRG